MNTYNLPQTHKDILPMKLEIHLKYREPIDTISKHDDIYHFLFQHLQWHQFYYLHQVFNENKIKERQVRTLEKPECHV